MPMLPRSTTAVGLLACLLLLGACAAPEADASPRRKPPERTVAWLVDHGEYVEALRLAEERARKHPDNEQYARDYRIASVALLMGRARRDLFGDRDERALEGFLQAQELAPEEPNVATWVQMTRHKLARKMELKASERHISDDLEGAIAAYEQALEFDPDYDPARQGLARALLQVNHRAGMGEEYYEEGIEALHDSWLEQANSSFAYSLKYTPEDARAKSRRTEVQAQLARQRVAIGNQLEEEGRFAAARNEYRMALLMDPDSSLALGGLTRMTVEAQAAEHLREADRAFLRRNYELANAEVEKARAMSSRLDAACDDLMRQIEEAFMGDVYGRARVLENDQRFEEAIAVYADLLEQAPYFRDAIARKDTLEDYVAEAGRLWAEAERVQDREAQAALLRRIETFWPEYRNLQERLARLDGAQR